MFDLQFHNLQFNFYKNIILKATRDSLDVNKSMTDSQIINHLRKRFTSEKKWELDHAPVNEVATDWFQGLAINVPHQNYEILELAKENKVLFLDPDHLDWMAYVEDQEDRFVERYWANLAQTFLAMSPDEYNECSY